MLYRSQLTEIGGANDQIDHIVVDQDRLQVKLIAKVIGLKEAIVDDNFAVYFFDAASCNLLGKVSVSGQGVGAGELGIAERICFVVIEIANRNGTIRIGTAAHGEIA